MTMISYAQNQEDVLLNRLFAPGRPGFYIDVGANDPIVDSVTKHFYDRGWRGVNVEPASRPYERLVAHRDRDVNLNIGLSDKEGTLEFFEFPGGLPGSSTFERGQAEWHRDRGVPFAERSVPVRTLADVCEEHVTGPIDFLSIDTEGHERHVLEGGDWSRWRPRVLVVEATEPNTLVPTHDQWEHLLTDVDYLFAAFDGLNRFYLRKEDADLLPALVAPVNVFDDYVPYKYSKAIVEARTGEDAVTRDLAGARALNDALQAQFGHLPAQLAWLRTRLEAVEGALRAHREQYAAVRVEVTQLDGLHRKLEADSRVSLAQAQELHRLLSSGTMSLAIRMAKATEHLPAAKKAARGLLRVAAAAKRAVHTDPD